MSKRLFISEKPSVAQEFAKALKLNGTKRDGYVEADDTIVTWCVGHLVTMSYPEKYDPALKKWTFQTLPFLPERFLYEVIPSVKKQFDVVCGLLNREDVTQIYVCTDSGREGEYIYRLVDEMAGVDKKKEKRRVWIDSQTEEEILRGIREAKPLSEYDNLSSAAYLRAKEDYLMGINFSRALTLKYGNSITNFLGGKWAAVSVGRVMTCVLGMVVRREREIRDFVETPFYRVMASLGDAPADNGGQPGTMPAGGSTANSRKVLEGEWRAVEGSRYFESPLLYKENGFKERRDAEHLITELLSPETTEFVMPAGTPKPGGQQNAAQPGEAGQTAGQPADAEQVKKSAAGNDGKTAVVQKVEKKKENKNPPMLYNLAELQNDCSRMFKISPDETLKVVQELYEKKLVTYPRTDARVLSTAVAKEIQKNLSGLRGYQTAGLGQVADQILAAGSYKGIAKTKYTNDKQITDHYAIIPTGQGLGQIPKLSSLSARVYQAVVRRFLCIFLPPAVYQKIGIVSKIGTESFFTSFKLLVDPGYLTVATPSGAASAGDGSSAADGGQGAAQKDGSQPAGTAGSNGIQQTTVQTDSVGSDGSGSDGENSENGYDAELVAFASSLKKGSVLQIQGMDIKEGKTSPPKRYNSGSMILAMENAGQLIEDDDLRAQIKGSGIGTSATRAEILNKLVKIGYLNLNKKTQIITPAQQGEMVYEVVFSSIRSLLNPELTASWEKGLTYVSEGTITEEEYMQKLERFVYKMTDGVKRLGNQTTLRGTFEHIATYYK